MIYMLYDIQVQIVDGALVQLQVSESMTIAEIQMMLCDRTGKHYTIMRGNKLCLGVNTMNLYIGMNEFPAFTAIYIQ